MDDIRNLLEKTVPGSVPTAAPAPTSKVTKGEDGGDLKRVRAPRLGGAAALRPRGNTWMLVLCLVFLLMPAAPVEGQPSDVYFEVQRRRMVEEQIARRGIKQQEVLEAMAKVPRHLFVPSIYTTRAYEDRPLPIGRGQTISQPYIVALMTELLELGPSSKVLEVGTGSGYHAAVLSQVAGEVYSIEILRDLAESARDRMGQLGYRNVEIRQGDGYQGWAEKGPFDAIILTAAPAEPPRPLLDQLKVGGKLVLPQGSGPVQDLLVLTKTQETLERQKVAAVRFVPMTGEAENREE